MRLSSFPHHSLVLISKFAALFLLLSRFSHAISLEIIGPPLLGLEIASNAPAEPLFLQETTDFKTFATLDRITNSYAIKNDKVFAAYRVQEIDPDAAAYFTRTSVSSPSVQSDVSSWFAKLKQWNLFTSTVYMASFRPQHVADVRGISLPALVGPSANPIGSLAWEANGLRFEGLSRLSLTNFLPAHIQEFSIFVVFKSDYGTTNALLLGNDAGTQLSGPSLWSGGTPYIYADPENLSVTVSSNGLVVAEPTFHWANTFNWGDTSFPQ
ncbi:MAG TPA: hypothetical protein VGR78_19025, partial [Verrucomicrobiae bacterium]|nr:hypothetical protein [Verrucomicrobiae bacterium]